MLQFFHCVTYSNADLEIYCALPHCLLLPTWFLSMQYEFQPSDGQMPVFFADYAHILKLDSDFEGTFIHNNIPGSEKYPPPFIATVWNFVDS